MLIKKKYNNLILLEIRAEGSTMFFIIEEAKETVLFLSIKIFFSFWYNININMIQYNMLNEKLSNSQLNKMKSPIKNGTEVALNFSSNIIGDSNDKKCSS